MKVTFLCVWSFLKDYVTWEDLLSRTLKLSLLLRTMNCVWFLSVVSVLVGVHVTGVWNLQQFHSSQECFFWRPLHTLTHTLTLARRCWPGHRLLCVMMVFTGCVLSCSVRLDFLHGFSARFPHFSPPPLPLHLFLFASWLFLPPSQAKVRELEEKCRTQSEQFNLLSKELEKFRLHAGKFDILSTEPLTVCESPGSPNKSLSQLLNGLAAPVGKGRTTQPSYQPFQNCVVDYFIMNYW